MRFEFFLPTEDEWCGTYEGGYVKVVVSNELSPKRDVARVGFWGNDDYALIKDIPIGNIDKDLFMSELLKTVLSFETPVSITYLAERGFEVF